MKYFIKIQYDSNSNNNQELPILPSQDSEDANETVNDLTDETLSGEGANETVNDLTDET
jgi:hypothetical protein